MNYELVLECSEVDVGLMMYKVLVSCFDEIAVMMLYSGRFWGVVVCYQGRLSDYGELVYGFAISFLSACFY